jgi:hypothetical protein
LAELENIHNKAIFRLGESFNLRGFFWCDFSVKQGHRNFNRDLYATKITHGLDIVSERSPQNELLAADGSKSLALS